MNEDVMQDVMQIVGDMLADPTCEISCEIGTTRVRDYTRGEVMHTPDTHRKTLVIKIGGGASQGSGLVCELDILLSRASGRRYA